MIANELHIKPMLSFGLGVLEKTITLGDTVTIFQNNIYNTDEVVFIFNGARKPIYGFDFTPSSIGVHNLECTMQIKVARATLKSNIIKLNVV